MHQNSTPLDVSDESVAAGAQAVFDYAHATVRDEDYRLVGGLQANLESGARDHLLFGRNEPGLQHRHITWAQALAGIVSCRRLAHRGQHGDQIIENALRAESFWIGRTLVSSSPPRRDGPAATNGTS